MYLQVAYLVTLLVSFSLMITLSLYAWRRRATDGAAAFSAMTALSAWGSLCDIFVLTSTDYAWARFWFNARFVGIAGFPVLWLLFALHYSGSALGKRRPFMAVLFILPAVTQIMVWTNHVHEAWVVRDVSLYRIGIFMAVDTYARVPAPWFWVHSLYCFTCLIIGLLVIIGDSFRRFRQFRNRSIALWVGILFILAGAVLSNYRLIPGLTVNPLPLSLSIASLLFAWAIFANRFFDIVPIARDVLVDIMEECMIVIDMKNRITDLNPSMRALLAAAFSARGKRLPRRLIGVPVARVLLPWNAIAERFRDTTSVSTEIAVMIGGDRRCFDLLISPLVDRQGILIGRMIVLHDITLRKHVEEELTLSEARLEALHTLSSRAFEDEKALIDYALEEAVRLTGSRIGYFHFVGDDQVTIELTAWTAAVMESCTAESERHYPLDAAGVWADCARLRRPVIHNDYPNLPDRKGYPEGHSPITRHLSVPIIEHDRVRVISGVANKGDSYDERDVRQLQLFMDGVWLIIERQRMERERATLLETLGRSEKRLRERNERMEFDLKIAQAAQKGLITGERPAFRHLLIESRYKPMDKVGGDYFSFFPAGEDLIGFFIGDVSGHGIASALFIALLKSTTTRIFQEHGDDPAAYLGVLNRELIQYMSPYFITAIYGIFEKSPDRRDIRLAFANGGHSFPIIVKNDGELSFVGETGTLIGISETARFTTIEHRLEPGDRLFLYTDGIPETENHEREMLGFEDGLLDLFGRSRRPALSDQMDAVLESLNVFRGGRDIHDDITLIGFEVG